MEDMLNTGNEVVEEVGAAATEGQAGAQGDQEETQNEPEKKYTDADVDRIIAKKIAAERSRMQKLFTEEQQVSELEIREREVLKRELKANAMDKLIADNMPSSLAMLMDYSSEEGFKRSYKEVVEVFQEIMNVEIKKRFAGAVPKVGTGLFDSSSAGTRQQMAIQNAFAPKKY